MPIDINWLRTPDRGGDPERWRKMVVARGKTVELVDNVIALDEAWRKAQYELEQAKKERGQVQKGISEKMKAKVDAAVELARKAEIEKAIEGLEAKAEELLAARDKALDLVPNELDESVPVSNNEADNAIVKTWGSLRPNPGDLLHHDELLTMIDGYEAERGVGVAGHRAYFLKGPGLMLNQALINYGLSFLMARKYTPLQPPFFMNKDVMAGVAQLADFDEQLYKVTGEDEKYLIATSEQPLCAFHRGEWLGEKDLPKMYAGYSTCFRKEAGSHGRDVWGIFRVHQFEKVEQFVVCAPEDSKRIHEEMMQAAEEFYQGLGLSYRVVNIVSGELNNAAAKKYDLEAWFPTFQNYRELVSCSNCMDYQARAMEVRYGHAPKKSETGTTKAYCHFLNSTLCATERTICCILENYQTPEGIRVPDALVPFMGGMTFIPFVRERPTTHMAAAAPAGKDKAAAEKKPAADKKPADKKAAAEQPKPAAAAAAAAPVTSAAGGAASAAAPAVAPAHASKPSALSGAVLGIVGKPATTSPAGLAALNNALAIRSYVADYTPTAEDEAAFNAMTAAGIRDGGAALASYPNVARWYRHIASFSASERAEWPLTQAQLMSGAVNARVSTLFA